MQTVVDVTDLTLSFPGSPPFLTGEITAQQADLVLVCGHSGSGKTSLLNVLSGVSPHLKPAHIAGEIRVLGRDPRDFPTFFECPEVGYLFQLPDAQLFNIWVSEEVETGEALDAVGASHLWSRRVDQLSMGEKQRVALAGLLARNPEPRLLLLDEPLAFLDPAGRRQLVEVLRSLTARGITIVVVEHRVELLLREADRVYTIDNSDLHAVSRIDLESITPGRRTVAEAVISVEEVTFGYRRGRPVLKDVSLTLRRGEWVAVTGANGSGKSTLGRLILGDFKPWAGTVRTFGNRGSALLPDIYPQILAPTPAQEMALASRLVGNGLCPGNTLQEFGLSHAAHSPVRSLSVGEALRTILAAGALQSPDFFVLDEPTVGQDRKQLGILAQRLEHLGTGVLMLTHDNDLVGDSCDRVLSMNGGKLIETVWC